jgi:DNA-binding MarR family transcriptional regulator
MKEFLWLTMARSHHSEHSGEGIRSIGDLDRIIHEPARLMIMSLLSTVTSADFTFITAHTGLTWGNVSSHLTKLEESGYIAIEKSFVDKKPRTMLTLTREGRSAFESYIRTMKHALGM